MPKIVTPETRKADCLAHADNALKAAKGLERAIKRGDTDGILKAAKVLEAAGCYIRRNGGRL